MTGVTTQNEDGKKLPTRFMCHYWRPISRKSRASDEELYVNCLEQRWRICKEKKARCEHAEAICWSYPVTSVQKDGSHKIPTEAVKMEKSNLALKEQSEGD